jgi:hypothetical protein
MCYLGLDLVAAVRRQTSFMERVLALADHIRSEPNLLDSCVADYKRFLANTATSVTLEPSLLVDLVWHTHQQFPEEYAAACLSVTGRLVDHLDD